jgi:hypothetical protein
MHVKCEYSIAMNRSKPDSIAQKIQKRILKGGGDRLWSFRDFVDIDPLAPMAVAAALSRLSRGGELRRIRRGLYYRPKKTAFGESQPNPESVVKMLLQNRNSVRTHEFNRLGLTNQMSGALTNAASRTTRLKGVEGVALRFVKRPLSEQKGIRDDERTVLDALRGIDTIPDTTPAGVIARIKLLIKRGQFDFDCLARFASTEPPRVRALLGAISADAGVAPDKLDKLRSTLNPLSAYRIAGAADALKHSASWQIK